MSVERRPRVLRVYHAGRDPAHRQRERALVAAGVDVTLVVPREWPDPGSEATLSAEPFRVVELDVARPGDVNRHSYRSDPALAQLMRGVDPDVLDLHEEPFSAVTRQWLRHAGGRPVVLYTAQNIDKRYPPPFAQNELRALRRADALYPCSRQAASVARGKGFAGLVEPLPLGVDGAVARAGGQRHDDALFELLLVGRLVPEKGVRDAVRVLATAHRERPCRLTLAGSGPELPAAIELARALGVERQLEHVPWSGAAELGELYRRAHVVLVPSRRTATWVEQFGRVIIEAQACGAVVAGYASGAIGEIAGRAALLAAEGDVGALAQHVVRLATQPRLFEERRAAGLLATADKGWAAVARRQAALYRQVLADGGREAASARRLARVPGQARSAAVEEFGPTAATTAGARPFALPVLRGSVLTTRVGGRAVDTIVDLRRRVGRSVESRHTK